MSNHFISTQDYSEAFFARWLLVEFPNSRLRSGLPIDAGLADKIIKAEMPGIANWALEGARRLLENEKFSGSVVHDRLMGEWRRNRINLAQARKKAKALKAEFLANGLDPRAGVKADNNVQTLDDFWKGHYLP